MAMMTPMAMDPHCPRMRTGCPATTEPDPAAAPFPIATNPNICRIGCDRNKLNLRWWGRRVFDNDFAGGTRRRWLDIDRAVAINNLTFHTACEERPGGND